MRHLIVAALLSSTALIPTASIAQTENQKNQPEMRAQQNEPEMRAQQNQPDQHDQESGQR